MHCQAYTMAASACLPCHENGKEKWEDVSLLQLAADNDVDGFRTAVEGGACIDEPEAWYGRQIGGNEMALQQRTAVMIASLYGSVEVLSYILSIYEVYNTDVNSANCLDGLTPLHFAAGGGSARLADTVKLLIRHGADVTVKDAHGRRPIDVLIVPPQSLHVTSTIQRILEGGDVPEMNRNSDVEAKTLDNKSDEFHDKLKFSLTLMEENDSDKLCSDYGKMDGLLSASSTDSFSSFDPSSPLFSPLFPSSPKSSPTSCDSQDNSKGYLSDASVPDIKNNIYTTDEFRMFSFKIRPCSRAYSHDWTECPFVHPGENARRRDPRRYHYSCVPCPDFRKGACRRGDSCEYAHGVFECWLHPAQYRTRLCKDGTSCARRVCFFAHTAEELRPLFVSTGSALPSPRASCSFDSRCISPPLQPFSPSQMMMVSPYSPSSKSINTPPLSPSSSSLRASLGCPWSPPSVPMLHLPSGSLHSSRLRAARSARDIPVEDLDEVLYSDPFVVSDLSGQSNQVLPTSPITTEAGRKIGRVGKSSIHGLNLSSSNVRDLWSSELKSPRSAARTTSLQELSQMSPKSLHYRSQDQLQMQINALLSATSSQQMSNVQEQGMSRVENQIKQLDFFSAPLPTSSFGMPGVKSKGPVSPAASLVPDSSMSFSKLKSPSIFKEKGSLSSKDLFHSAALSDWGSPNGKPDWGAGHDLGKLHKTSSFAAHGEFEPDFSWVQSLVKDGPGDLERVGHTCSSGNQTDGTKENVDRIFGAWLEQTRQKVVA